MPRTYTVTVTNAGPSNSTNAAVASIVPPNLAGRKLVDDQPPVFAGVTDTTTSGTGNISDSVNLPGANGNIVYTVTGTIAPNSGNSLTTSASVTRGTGASDPDTSNNVASDTDVVNPASALSADISVTITDSDMPTPVSITAISESGKYWS